MNLTSLLSKATQPNCQAVEGIWQNIRWRPDAATGEVLNLGVRVKLANGQSVVRLIESFDRVKCLYDASVASDAQFLVRVVGDALAEGFEIPATGVFLSEEKYASGTDVCTVVDDLFVRTVPLARPRADAERVVSGLRTEPTDAIRSIVFDELRRISGLRAESIIRGGNQFEVREPGKTHYLDIPLQSNRALGTIVSARFAKKKDAELRLLRADNDLQIARRVYQGDRMLMYVVRHDSGAAAAERFDELLDDFSWKFNKVGVEMKSYSDPLLVAEDVVADMLVA